MREINIKSNIHDYSLLISSSLIRLLETNINKDDKYFVVFDKNVDNFYLNKIKEINPNITPYIVEGGEHLKSFDVYVSIVEALLSNQFSKNDYLIGVGGGTLLDLCGFVASTYKRGIKYISCPTTTLAMIDASIGGKNGINFNNIKNSIGTIFPPDKILLGFDVLKTLPTKEMNNGLFEALKMGLIYDEPLFNLFKDNNYKEHIPEIIMKAIEDKIYIVEKDEFDKDYRKILNFGHTYGHAIESISDFDISHGEAIANGMLLISKGKYFEEDLRKILIDMECRLISSDNLNKICSFISNDKKAKDDCIDVVVVDFVGKAQIKNIKISSLCIGD